MKKPFYISENKLATIHFTYTSQFTIDDIKKYDKSDRTSNEEKFFLFRLDSVEIISDSTTFSGQELFELNRIVKELETEATSTIQTIKDAYEDYYGF